MASRNGNMHRFVPNGMDVTLSPEITFGTTGTPTVVTAGDKSMGVKTCVQALASSSIYALSLLDPYVRVKWLASIFSTSVATKIPAVSVQHIVSEVGSINGGIALISCASVAAQDTITIQKKDGAAVTFTAVAYNATPSDKEFCIGNTTGADNESANNIAAIIRNDSTDAGQSGKGDTNGNGGWAAADSTITAYAIGAVVVISASVPGWQICTSNVTRLMFKATGTGVADTKQTMWPGVAIQFAVGITPTCPASGDKARMQLCLENSTRGI